MTSAYKVLGIEKTIKALNATTRQVRGAVAGAIYQAGIDLVRSSVRQVPIDQGTLESSHYVAPPTEVVGEPSCEVGYGTSYAIYVHERTELKHRNGRKAKFLSDPFDKIKNRYAQIIGAKAKSNLERGLSLVVDPSTPTTPKSTGERRKAARKSVSK
jgi:hypothetical protein